MSGGNLIVESSSQIQVMSSQYAGQAALLIKPDRFSVFTGQSSYDISYVTFAALGFLGVSYQYTTDDIYNRIQFIGSNTLNGNSTLIGSDASGASDLVVYGNIRTQNNGNITGAQHFFLTGDASLNQKLYVAGNANMNSNVDITLDLSVNQNVYVTGRSSFTNDVSMNRNVDIGTGNNSVAINKDISTNVALDVSGSTVLRGPLSITGDTSFNRSLQIGSDLSINRFLNVNNNALFNTDVSINQNLYVSGRATFGRPPTNGTTYEVDVSGQMRIYEPSGTLATATSGSLVLQHGDASGVSSIVFRSTNDSGSDYAYIQYQENVGGGATQKGLFTIGIENESGSGTAADRISLYAAGGSGFVGVNTKDPQSHFDVSGNARISGTVTASLDVSLNKNVKLGSSNNSVAINKDISSNFALDVSGITNLRAPLYALSDVSLSQKLFVSLDASFNQSLSIGQDVSINRSLYVQNRSLFSSDVSINGFTKLNNSVAINKDISSSFALDVSGITNLRAPLYALSDVSLSQKLFVSLDASFNQNLSVGQDVSINRSLYVRNRALFSRDVSINGFTKLNNSVAINKDISSSFALDVSGITNLRAPLYTLSDVSFSQKLFVSLDASFNQNLSVGQDVSINRSLYVLNRALFSNDVSLNRNVDIGTGNNSVAINKDISSNFALDVSGTTVLRGQLSTLSDVSINGKLSVSGDISFNGNVAIGEIQTIGIGLKQPPEPMTANVTNIPGHGSYYAYTSSLAESLNPYIVFDNSNETAYLSNNYVTVMGDPSINVWSGTDTISDVTSTAYPGYRFHLDLPYQINLSRFDYRAGHSNRYPVQGSMLGSNDGTSWNHLYSFDLSGTYNNATFQTGIRDISHSLLSNNSFYSKYALVIKSICKGNRYNLYEIKLFGNNNILSAQGIGTTSLGVSDNLTVGSTANFYGNVTIGNIENIYNRTGAAKLLIMEPTGTVASATSGSLVLQHGDASGASSIVFRSTNDVGSDYAYIQYRENVGGGATQKGLLTIGVENDSGSGATADRMSLYAAGGSGFVGVNTLDPQSHLDISGNARISGTVTASLDVSLNKNVKLGTSNNSIAINKDISSSFALDVSGITNLRAPLYTLSDVSLGQKLFVTLDASFNQNLSIGQDVSINRFLYVNNNALFNGDVSTNKNLYVSGKATFGRPPTDATYELDVSGQMRIYEASGSNVTTASSVGTLTLEHGDASGCSSIMFKSPSTVTNGDYAYIKYQDLSGTTTTNAGLLTIGIENDTTAVGTRDRISLYAAGGSGFVGVNTLDPSFNLDVSGNANVTNTLITNKIDVSNSASTMDIAVNQISGTLNIGTNLNRTANINIGDIGNDHSIRIGNFDICGNSVRARADQGVAVFSSYNLTGGLRIGESMSSGIHQYSVNQSSGSVQIAGTAKTSGSIEIGCGNNNASHTMSIGTGLTNAGLLNIANGATSTGNVNIMDGSGSTGTTTIGRDNAIRIVNSATTTVDISAAGQLTLRGSTVRVFGSSLFNSDVSLNGNVKLGSGSNSIAVNKDISSEYALDVSGITVLRAPLYALSDVSLGQKLFVSQDVSFNQNLSIGQDVSINRFLHVNNNALFNGDVSTNKNLYVSGKATFGRPPTNTTYELDVSGQMRIYEPIGSNVTTASSVGTLTLEHGDASGCSSIMFKSPSTVTNGDYAYIKYQDLSGTTTTNAGLLTIGIENDTTAVGTRDRISLYAAGGSGFVGVNTLDPSFNLDVSGNANVTNTLITNTIDVSNSASTMDIAVNQISGILNIGTDPSRNGTINIGTGVNVGRAINIGTTGTTGNLPAIRIGNFDISDNCIRARADQAIAVFSSYNVTNGSLRIGESMKGGTHQYSFNQSSGSVQIAGTAKTSGSIEIGCGNNNASHTMSIGTGVTNAGLLNIANGATSTGSVNIMDGSGSTGTTTIGRDNAIRIVNSTTTNVDISAAGQLTLRGSTVRVFGSSLFNSDVSLNGNVKLGSGSNSIAVNKDISSQYALDVSGITNLRAPLHALSDVSLNQKLFVSLDASFNQNLSIGQDVSINRSLYVLKRALFSSDVSINGFTKLNNSVSINKDISSSFALDVSGITNLRAPLHALSDVSLNQKLFVSLDASFNQNLSIGQDVSINRSLYVLKRALFSSDVSINGFTKLNNSVSINKDISSSFALDVSGITNLRAPLYTLSDVSLGQKLFVSLDASFNQNLSIGQDVSINRSLYVLNRALFSSDVSLNRNVKLGSGNNFVAINKDISSNFALDVSGLTALRGDVSMNGILFAKDLEPLTSSSTLDIAVTQDSGTLNIGTLNRTGTINIGNSGSNSRNISIGSSNGVTYIAGSSVRVRDVGNADFSVGRRSGDANTDSMVVHLASGVNTTGNVNIMDGSGSTGTTTIGRGNAIRVVNSATTTVDISAQGTLTLRGSRINMVGDVSVNQNLEVLGKGTFGRPPSTNAAYELDLSGQMRIYEPIGSNVTTNTSVATLTLQHGDASGCSSIMFTSPSTTTNGDYAYIKYQDLSGATTNAGLLTIGIENDTTAAATRDRISLYAAGGSGFVGVNTLDPSFNLDVSGNVNVSSTLITNRIDVSNSASNMDIAVNQITGILNIGTGARNQSGTGQVNINTSGSSKATTSIGGGSIAIQGSGNLTFNSAYAQLVANIITGARNDGVVNLVTGDVSGAPTNAFTGSATNNSVLNIATGSRTAGSDINIASNTSSAEILSIGTGANRTGAINIGTGSTGTKTIGLGGSNTTVNVVGRSVTFASDMSMNKNVQLGSGSNSIAVNKDISSEYALDVSGITVLRAPLYTLSDVSLEQKLFVSGDVSFNQNLFIGQDVSINRSLYVNNNSLFNGDVSVNQNLYVLGKATFGRPPTNTTYELDVSGQMRIYEAVGSNVTTNTSVGTLTLEHGDASGCSSIMFTSPSTVTNGDYAYIKYQDLSGTTTNAGLLTIGIENDPTAATTADKISLYAAGGTGYVGVNTLNPQFNLDVTGQIRATSTITASTITASTYTGSSNISLFTATTANISIGGATALANVIAIGTSASTGSVRIGGNIKLGYGRTYVSVNKDISTGFLFDVSGDSMFRNKLFVNSDASFGTNVNVVGDVSVNRFLFVTDRALFGNDVSINGYTQHSNSVSINKDISSEYALDVSGLTNLRGNLTTTNITTNGSLSITGGGSLTVNGLPVSGASAGTALTTQGVQVGNDTNYYVTIDKPNFYNDPSLVIYYNFDTSFNNGTVVRNIATSGPSYDASFNRPSVFTTDGMIDTSVQKYGTASLKNVGGTTPNSGLFVTSPVPIGTIMSFSMWIKKSDVPSVPSFDRIFEYSDNATSTENNTIALDISNSGVIIPVLTNGTSPLIPMLSSPIIPYTICDNTWNHIVWVITATESYIYINGAIKHYDGITGTVPSVPRQNAYIAYSLRNDVNRDFSGNIDEFRYYKDKALNQAEIFQLSRNTFYNLDISGGFLANGSSVIYEPVGSKAGPNSGSLTLLHGDASGSSSIMFKSVNDPSEYGYIQYEENSAGSTGFHYGLMTIGIENDTGAQADRISLFPSGGQGFVGVNTKTPQTALDVSGQLRIFEGAGTSASPSAGSLVLEHTAVGGTSSIMFKGPNSSTSDYAYVQYTDASSVIQSVFKYDLSSGTPGQPLGNTFFRSTGTNPIISATAPTDNSFAWVAGTSINGITPAVCISFNQTNLNLTNTTSRINYLQTNGFPSMSSFTFSAWIRPGQIAASDASDTPLAWMIANLTSGAIGANGSVDIWLENNGRIYALLGDDGVNYIATNSVLVVNTWYHLVFTFDGNLRTGFLYLNGALNTAISGSALSGKVLEQNNSLLIGMKWGWNSGAFSNEIYGYTNKFKGFRGHMAFVNVFDRGISASDVQYLYNNPAYNLATNPDRGLMTIGVENDTGAINNDRIVLWPGAGSGSVGVNTRIPRSTLDVSGTLNVSSTITSNNGTVIISGQSGAVLRLANQSPIYNSGETLLDFYGGESWRRLGGIGCNDRSQGYDGGFGSSTSFYTTADTSYNLEAMRITGKSKVVADCATVSVYGDVSINGIFRTSNAENNKKIVLWDMDNLNNTNFYGFGLNLNTLRYQTNSAGSHKFFSGDASGNIGCGKILMSESGAGTYAVPAGGSLTLQHQTEGRSSIVFRSATNAGTDYGYIQYEDHFQSTDFSGNTFENGLLTIGVENDGPIGNVADRMCLWACGGSGFVGVNTKNPLYTLDVNGTVNATGYCAFSDYRIKENVMPLDLTFNVDVLKPVSYILKDDKDAKLQIGFIAHEVQEFYPFLVNGNKDGPNTQSINYNGFIGILTKEIKDLKKKASVQEERLASQEERLASQEERLASQEERLASQEARLASQEAKALEQEAKALEQEARLQALEKLLLNK